MVYVLDTSAILAVLLAEKGYQAIVEVLQQAEAGAELYLPFIGLMELHYRMLRLAGPDEALAASHLVERWPARIVESSHEWRYHAAEIKARGGLSVADAWIAALAIERDATLFHKDPEFERVAGLRTQFIS